MIAETVQPFRSKAADFLDEMAQHHWRLGTDSPGMAHHIIHAMKLHAKALKLRYGILDDDL